MEDHDSYYSVTRGVILSHGFDIQRVLSQIRYYVQMLQCAALTAMKYSVYSTATKRRRTLLCQSCAPFVFGLQLASAFLTNRSFYLIPLDLRVFLDFSLLAAPESRSDIKLENILREELPRDEAP